MRETLINDDKAIQLSSDTQDYRTINRELKKTINFRLIGSHMQNARMQQNMTQAAIAERMHLGEKYYSLVETGKSALSLARFIQFVCLTQTSADALLTGCHTDYPHSVHSDTTSEMRRNVDCILDQCSDEMLRTIYALIKGLIQYDQKE